MEHKDISLEAARTALRLAAAEKKETTMVEAILKLLRGSVRPVTVYISFAAVAGFFAFGEVEAAKFVAAVFASPAMIWWFSTRQRQRDNGA
jgi:hypothetical protein